MTTLDPQLMFAYIDGELDDETAAAVRAAIDADPMLNAKLNEHRELRNRVQGAYLGILDEALPDRLLQALEAPPAAATIELSAARDKRARRQSPVAHRPASTWARWGGLAASLVAGVSIGLMLPNENSVSHFGSTANGLVASGRIAEALSNQLASEPAADSPVSLQISFLDQAGHYCRTFTTPGLAGMACRDGRDWTLQALLPVENASPQSAMRQAATPLPATLLQMVDERMRGDSLDAVAERAARQRGWQR